MRKFKMHILTQTDNQKYRKNVATNGNCVLEKMGLKFQNPSFNTMQNIILEQAKVDLKSDKFGSQLDKKNKTWFLTFPNVYVS